MSAPLLKPSVASVFSPLVEFDYPFSGVRTPLQLAPSGEPDFIAMPDTALSWILASAPKSLKKYSVTTAPIKINPIEQLVIYREISGNLRIMLKMRLGKKDAMFHYNKMHHYLIEKSFIEEEANEDLFRRERTFYIERNDNSRKLLATILDHNTFTLEALEVMRGALLPPGTAKPLKQEGNRFHSLTQPQKKEESKEAPLLISPASPSKPENNRPALLSISSAKKTTQQEQEPLPLDLDNFKL